MWRWTSLILSLAMAACSVGPAKPVPASAGMLAPQTAGVSPQDIEQHYAQALELMRRHQDAPAIALLQDLGQHSDAVGPLINLGILYARQQRFDEAVAALRRALQRRPGQGLASRWLASVLRQQAQPYAAEQVLLQAIEHAPDDPALHRNLALLYEQDLRQPEQALRHYRRYQALQQGDALIVEAWIRQLQERQTGMAARGDRDQ